MSRPRGRRKTSVAVITAGMSCGWSPMPGEHGVEILRVLDIDPGVGQM